MLCVDPNLPYPSTKHMFKGRVLIAITLAEQGGAQSFVLKLAKYLRENGTELLIAAGPGEWLKHQCEAENLDFVRIPSLKRDIDPMNDFKAERELESIIREFAPDAVHLNSTKIGFLGSYAAKRANVKNVVYRIGGWVFLEDLPAWKKTLYKMAETFSARWKDTILCVHPGDAETAKRAGIKPKKELLGVPNGIDIERFRKALLPKTEARNILGVGEDEMIFGTVANFYPPKNLPNYMHACRLVADQMPEAKFVIIGDGMERKKIEAAISERNLNGRVILPGAINNAETLLSAFDVFVLPSSKEGMAFALLEAMSAGLPSVATDVGAASYMLENGVCGWLAPHDDMNALAENMLHAASSLPENKKGKLAAAKAERDFPLHRTLEANRRALLG